MTTTLDLPAKDYYMRMGEVNKEEVNKEIQKVISFNIDEIEGQNRENADKEARNGYAASIASSAITAAGIADKTSYFVVCFVVFVSDMSRGIFFPTQWNLVQSLGGNEITLGYTVGSFSFGRILVSPTYGKWSATYGYKKTLLFCNFIQFLGCILYSQIPAVGKIEFLIFCNICLGVGSATVPVTRAFVAEVTATRERTTYIAWLTALQYAGTAVTPFIGSFLVYIYSDENNVVQKGLFLVNEYTAPAYFLMCMVMIMSVLLLTVFTDRYKESKPAGARKSSRKIERERLQNELVFFGKFTRYDACLYGCMLLNTATKGTIACFETLGIEFAESHFSMYRANAGTIVACSGTIGVILILSIGKISQYLNDAEMVYGGISLVVVGVVMNSFLSPDADNPVWKFVIMILIIYGIGYPIGHTALVGLFSKLVGRRAQGPLQGWFAVCGSFARVCFPIMAGYIVKYLGIETLFYFLTVIAGSAVGFAYYFRESLTQLSV